MAEAKIDFDAVRDQVRDAIAEFTETLNLVSIFGEVGEAIESARAKHGDQKHLPINVGPKRVFFAELGDHVVGSLNVCTNAEVEAVAKLLCEQKPYSWEKIAFEEVTEFLGADGLEEARKEALQCAAMFVSIVQVIDSRTA